MTQHRTVRQWLSILPLAVSGFCYGAAGSALVVHDDTGLATEVVGNLSDKLSAAGYTVATNIGVPLGSLAPYKQIWDLRFNNTTPLSSSDITAYIAYLRGGGSLFVMGENIAYMARDNSIVTLVRQAGGGEIAIVDPASSTQSVQWPFTGPSPLQGVTFRSAAGTPNPANGAVITKDGSGVASAIVFGPGNLAAAPAGSLLIVFDYNFLQFSADLGLQTLTDNMIAYMAAPVVVAPPPSPQPVATPSLSEWVTMLLGAGLIFVASRRLSHSMSA